MNNLVSSLFYIMRALKHNSQNIEQENTLNIKSILMLFMA